MTEIEPDEAIALAEAAGDGGERQRRAAVVSLRDFSEPRTLSADRIAHIRGSLGSRLQSITNALAGPLRGHPTIALGEVAEMNAHGLFDGYVRPFLVYGFECGGGLGWIVWSPGAARRAVDRVLSGEPGETDEGANPILTRTERRVVGSLMFEITSRIGEALGIETGSGEVWQEAEELTTLEDLGPDADSRRLLVHLTAQLDGDDGSTDLRLYLPGIADPEIDAEEDDDGSAPPHLESVDLDLSAHLGSTYVPLSELLELEVGDVIPLDARVGALVEVEIEETICARARFGAKDGLMSILIEEAISMPLGDTESGD